MNKPWSKRNAVRRKKEILYKSRMLEKANYGCFPGIYTKDVNGTKIPAVYPRGSMSRYYKTASARKVRRSENAYKGGEYKRAYDFWWKLI